MSAVCAATGPAPTRHATSAARSTRANDDTLMGRAPGSGFTARSAGGVEEMRRVGRPAQGHGRAVGQIDAAGRAYGKPLAARVTGDDRVRAEVLHAGDASGQAGAAGQRDVLGA